VLNLPFPVVVVCATCEYESWFLASLHTIMPGVTFEGDPEKECGAKGWLTRQMPAGHAYKETSDQVRMTNDLDIPHVTRHSRSFRRMVEAVGELLEAIDLLPDERGIVTPT
jgi:hypothetical protein